MLTIALSLHALAAARRVDPHVSTAAVRAAVEAALDHQRHEGTALPPSPIRGAEDGELRRRP